MSVTTSICRSTAEDIFVRERSLTRELMGKVTFTELMLLSILGEAPTAAQVRVVDACLVTLMEHGMTPTVVAARMTYSNAPESMQGAVAAGLSSVGSVFVGTMEGCATLLVEMVASADADAVARQRIREYREAKKALPGFGHPIHRPDDPRTPKLFEIAASVGLAGAHVAALKQLSAAIDDEFGRHLTINATGAIAAVLLDAGVSASILRGFALISRCAGLVGHIREEQQRPTMRALWQAAEEAVPYHDDGKR
jgi:citrate synthase